VATSGYPYHHGHDARELEMTKHMLGRWVAGAAVFAALGFGLVMGGGFFTTQDLSWNSPVLSGVLR